MFEPGQTAADRSEMSEQADSLLLSPLRGSVSAVAVSLRVDRVPVHRGVSERLRVHRGFAAVGGTHSAYDRRRFRTRRRGLLVAI